MKNKSNFFISIIFFLLINSNLSYGNELVIKALTIETFEEGNIIHGTGKAEASTIDGLEIFANKFSIIKTKAY